MRCEAFSGLGSRQVHVSPGNSQAPLLRPWFWGEGGWGISDRTEVTPRLQESPFGDSGWLCLDSTVLGPQGPSTQRPSPQRQVGRPGVAPDLGFPSSHLEQAVLVMTTASWVGSWGQPQNTLPGPCLAAQTSQVPVAAGPGPSLTF